MALVSNIQLQDGSVKPPNLDTNLKYTAAGLTATEAIAVGTVPVSTSGSITVKSANDVRNWIQTTKTDGNVEIYMSNDARPDWALRVAGTADNAFVIANSYGSNCTAQFPAFSIGGAGAVGLGKTGATNILDIAYKNSATGGIQLTETQNSVGAKLIAEATSASIGSTSNHKLGFRVNGTTVAAFNTSTQFGIGTDSPGATLDVRGGAIFNEAGAAVDFRIEGDAEPNLFFVDGSADAIGMGTATPVDTSRLHVMGTDGDAAATHSGDAMLIVENCGTTFLELATGNANHAGLTFSDAAAATRGAVLYDHGTGLGGAADTMMFQTAGSIRAVIDSSGEVGIGTLAPAAALHLGGVDDPEIRIEGASDGDPQINFYQGASTCRGTIMYKDTGDNFVMDSAGKVTLQTSSTPRLVITNAGCVGIGTNAVASACSTELDIFSAGASTSMILRSGNSSAAAAAIIGEGYRANGDNEQVFQIYGRNRNSGVDLGIFEIAAEAKHCEGKLEFKTFDGSSMTTKMIIRAEGAVGIGTVTPAEKLHVHGGVTIQGSGALCVGSPHFKVTSDGVVTWGDGVDNGVLTWDTGKAVVGGQSSHALQLNAGGSHAVTIDTSQNVGIGTTAPSALLDVFGGTAHIKGTGGGCIQLVRNDGTGTAGEFLGVIDWVSTDASTGSCGTMARIAATYDSAGDSAALRFVTGASTGSGAPTLAERMAILNTGKVGISTQTPGEMLTVHCTAGCDTAIAVYNTNTTSSAKASIKVGNDSANHLHIYRQGNLAGIFYDAKQSGSSHQFQIESTAIHTTTATGLGIGTTAPAYKLESATSSTSISYPLALTNPDTSTNASGVGIIGRLGRTTDSTLYSFPMMALVKDGTWTGSPPTNIDGNLRFYTVEDESSAERMRITSDGHVGIGTTGVPAAYDFAVMSKDVSHADSGFFRNYSGAARGYRLNIGAINASNVLTAATRISGNLESNDTDGYFTLDTLAGGTMTERVRVTNDGKVGINTTTRGCVFYEGGHSAQLQVEGTSPTDSGISIIRNNAQYGPNLVIARSCGTSVGSNTLVATGQTIGSINFQANDGTDFIQAAFISAKVGNHAASNCMSGEIQFGTSDGTNGSVTEKMRIAEDGRVGIGTQTPSLHLHVVGALGATTHMSAGNGIYIGRVPGDESEPSRIDTQSNGGGTCQLFIGNAAITVSSDRRVKNNIQCYTCSAVNVLDNARVVEFEYDKEKINDRSDFGPSSRGKYVGLIAQEMIEYARWAINDGEGDPEGEHIWKAEYEHMVPLLIKAVQELNERIVELETAA